jgi:hypothetical protein
LKALLVPKSKSNSKAAGEGHEGPSYLDMCRSILKKDLKKMKELGYFGDKVKVRLAGDEATLKTKSKEVIVFRNFFWANLRLSMYWMMAKVLQKYQISYLTSKKILKAPKILEKFLDTISHPMNLKYIFRALENVFKYLK